jgi:hypothetical protein
MRRVSRGSPSVEGEERGQVEGEKAEERVACAGDDGSGGGVSMVSAWGWVSHAGEGLNVSVLLAFHVCE